MTLPTDETLIDQAEVRRLLDYDPASGVLNWRVRERGLPGWSYGWNGKNAGKVAGARMGNGYITIRIFDNQFLAHRVVWLHVHGFWPPAQIDHINMVRDDNRIVNLRLATNSENTMNRNIQSNNTSGYRGVYFHPKSGLWNARVYVRGEQRSLGYFKTAAEASIAYTAAAKIMHHEFTRS